MAQYRNPYLEKVYREAGQPVPPVHPYPDYAFTRQQEKAARRAVKARENRDRDAVRHQGRQLTLVTAFVLSFLVTMIALRPAELGVILQGFGFAAPETLAAQTGGIGAGLLVLYGGFSLIRYLRPGRLSAESRRRAGQGVVGVILGVGFGSLFAGGVLDSLATGGGAE